jgi:hypothetical protein
MSTKNLQESSSGSAIGLGADCSLKNTSILDPGCPEASTETVRSLWGLKLVDACPTAASRRSSVITPSRAIFGRKQFSPSFTATDLLSNAYASLLQRATDGRKGLILLGNWVRGLFAGVDKRVAICAARQFLANRKVTIDIGRGSATVARSE